MRALRRLGPLRRLRRRLLPEHVRADIRDYELIVALMERILEPDSDCLDVGAHEGLFLRQMVRIAPRGRHVAWEPLPRFARRLSEDFPGVDVREAALASVPGEVDFQHAVDQPGWSGLRARPTSRGSRFETIRVRAERLDDALAAGVQPRFIKIDVEGAEEEVVLGGFQTFREHRPVIVFEFGADAARLYGTPPDRFHDMLNGALGLDVQGLDGAGPFRSREFARIVRAGERHNFIAWPSEASDLPHVRDLRKVRNSPRNAESA